MTLVIVGHNLEKNLDCCFALAFASKFHKMKANGLFIASDSVITANGSNGETPILGGFRKVYPISIKIWKPYFLGLNFYGYQEIFFESECFVAFAGSTLTAQHVLNLISDHLSQLRISYEQSGHFGSQGIYKIIRHCQRNVLIERGSDTWDEGMFTSNDYQGIITAEVIAEVIEYSINEALSSARKYKLDEKALKSMYTEFAVGIHCPKTNVHKLYTFRMCSRLNDDGIIEVFVAKQEVLEHEIAVLGMRTEFEVRAQDILKNAIAAGITPAGEIFRFLNDAIDEISNLGSYAIDKPSILKLFKEGRLTKIEFQR